MALDTASLAARYEQDGFVSAVPILSQAEAAEHRARMEAAEARIGSIHYRPKIHTLLRSPWELATHPAVLDLAEAMLGPDILLYNATYIIKEPGTTSHVSWHQDLTYWGLSDDRQVTFWLALSPASVESGCMRMIPGSHRKGMAEHATTEDESNVLFHGQTVTGIDEDASVMCTLEPGEASFHHGWTLHASMPNRSADRRIGLNVQYLAAGTHQTKHGRDTAVLVRGEDRHGYFGSDRPAEADLEPEALARMDELERIYKESAGAV